MNIIVNGRTIPQAGNYYYDFFNQEMYMLLFYHDIRVIRTWNKTEIEENHNESKYSVLSHLSDKYKIKKKYQFLIEYPNSPLLIWRQSKKPMEETTVDNTENYVEGFEPVKIPFRNFTGLAVSSYHAFYDGTSYPDSWFYAIGVNLDAYDGSIPGPSGQFVKTVALWLKFPVQKRITCFIRRTPPQYFLLSTYMFLSK